MNKTRQSNACLLTPLLWVPSSPHGGSVLLAKRRVAALPHNHVCRHNRPAPPVTSVSQVPSPSLPEALAPATSLLQRFPSPARLSTPTLQQPRGNRMCASLPRIPSTQFARASSSVCRPSVALRLGGARQAPVAVRSAAASEAVLADNQRREAETLARCEAAVQLH